MTEIADTLPANCTDEPVYSNFDHELDADVVRQLAAAPGELHAQHSARDFCGYVWQRKDGRWVDQVWRYGAPVQDFVCDTVEAVIKDALDEYGYL
jgi:hypothetical protein